MASTDEPELTLEALDTNERTALVALARRLVELDGEVTVGEARRIASWAEAFGQEELRSLLEAARPFLDGKETLHELAAMVERIDARELLLCELFALAAENGIVPAESDLLEWLGETWGIEITVEPT